MSCEACATLVQKALSKIPGVDHCTVSYDAAEANCVVNSAGSLGSELLVRAVETVGYMGTQTSLNEPSFSARFAVSSTGGF